jgi:macrophage erythroblast attacher
MASKSNVNVDSILLLEQPFVRVPYENYRRVFRASQKIVEKELVAINTSANEAASRVPSPQESLKAIEGMIARAENLKRKVQCISLQNLSSYS